MAGFSEQTFQRLKGLNARQYANRARDAASRLGVPAPTWAVLPARGRPRKAKPVTLDAERAFTAAARAGTALPDELRAWREATGGVVSVSACEVVLTRWEGARRVDLRFGSTEAAVAALLPQSAPRAQ